MSAPESTPSPAEIEAIGYLTGAVTGYEREGGSSPVIVVPVGYVRTLLAALAAQEAARRESERLDAAQRLFSGVDFAYGDPESPRAVVVLDLPKGVRVGADFRAFLDAARQSTPTGATNE